MSRPFPRWMYSYPDDRNVRIAELEVALLESNDGAAKLAMESLVAHLHRQRAFSEKTFGPGPRAAGVIDHITKELMEIARAPDDLEEWIDVVLLALDGAWRAGHEPEVILGMLLAKQSKNEAREWPDWRTAEPGKAIEHRKAPALSGAAS